jgi:hypothetical protein
MIPLVPPASLAVAAVAVELVMVVPAVTSKDTGQPVFIAGQPTGAPVVPTPVSLKKIKSVQRGCVPPLVFFELK